MQTNIVRLTPRPRPLRADVPAFDPANDRHLRMWEAMHDFGMYHARREAERQS